MGSVWGLAMPLLLFCWKAGVAASSADLSIGSSAPVVTKNNTEVPASTQRDRLSSAGAFQTTDLTQYVPVDAQTLSAETASNTLAATSTSSEVNSGDTQTISPITETGKTQTTCPAASALDIQITSTTVSALETQTSSLAAFSIDTQASSPAASSLDTQTTSAKSSLDTQSTLENQTIFPVELTLKTQTISPVTETRTLAIRMPSSFTVVHPNPTDTSATSGSPKIEMSTVRTGTVSDPIEAVFDTLCTDDSSEETRKITVDLLNLAHTSTEAGHLSSESGSTLDNSAIVLTSPQVLGPDTAPPAKDLVAFSITQIETPAIIPGTSDTTGALSTSEILNSPQSPEANPLSPKSTSSFGTLSTTGTSALAITLEGTLPTSDVTERETIAAQTPTSGGTLVTVSTNPLKDTSALSIETQSHTEVLGTITVPRAAGSTMAETISSGSTSDSSPSAGATTKGSTTSETSTTDDRTGSSFFTGSSPLPFVYSTTASASKNPNVTLAKTTASPETPGMPSPSTPTTSWTRITPKHDPGEDGGFLLVQVSVASPEDLTEPKATEKLMYQVSEASGEK
ncbi:Muc20 [Lemmus lemmus]